MRLAIFIIIMILVRIASELTAMDETWLFILEAVAGGSLLFNYIWIKRIRKSNRQTSRKVEKRMGM